MNKSFIKSGLVVIAALVLASCSKTEEFQHNPDSALQIESVSGISPFALTTKAVITGNTLPGSDAATGIGIFVTAANGGAYDGHDSGYTNVNFANGGSGWSTSTPVYLSDTQGKLYGYFPYSGTANDLRAVPVQSSLNGTDYLYAEPQTVSHSNKSVSLQMKHALSCLHLTIKKGANFTAEAPLSKITLKGTAIDATGTMDLTTGAVTASKNSGETGTVELTTDGTITAEGIEKDILLVPADNSNGKKGISISLMIAGKPAGITIPAENGLDIRSGIQNNVTLTIEDTGIKVTGVEVGEWGEGGSQTVQVNGHTVIVKLSDDVTPHDILTDVYADGNAVKIEACSKSDRILDIEIPGNNPCTKEVVNRIYTFTISSIVSDVVVLIGYTDHPIFSVSKDGGKTRNLIYFSKGNLWADESKVLHFEPNQWEVKDTYDIKHISHFTWSSTVAAAVGNSNSGDYLFCDENHKVSVDGSGEIYYALSIDEWDYLFNKRAMEYVDFRYTLNITYGGKQGLVLYPDEYIGKALSGSFETLPENVVFLPYTGSRNGDTINEGGAKGYYVSSSTTTYNNIYRVVLKSDSIEIKSAVGRHAGSAVRLVAGY